MGEGRQGGERRGELVNLGDGGGEGGERSLFLPATKAVRGHNEHGEWCVSREALSRVSVRTRRKREREGIKRERQMVEIETR